MKRMMPAAAAPIGYAFCSAKAVIRLRHRQTDLAGHASPADAAVAVGILRQVLLVVVLGVVELRRRQDLGGDFPEARLAQRLLVVVARPFRGGVLRLVVVVDAGS